MSNSPLVSFTKISPNRTSPRNHAIDTITIHCVVGQCGVEALGSEFAKPSKRASANYGIGYDGRIGMYVEEKDRSWCSSSAANDNRAVTIEVASDTTKPYAVKDKAYAALIELVTDICRRNGIRELVWSTNKDDRVNHRNGCNMTVHMDYANKDCPGAYLYERHGQIAAEVNQRLTGEFPGLAVNYTGTVVANGGLNCRSWPVTGTVIKTYPNGSTAAITRESEGWGYTGEGWVSLQYIQKITEEEVAMTKEEVKQLIQEEVKPAVASVQQAAVDAAKKAAPEIVLAYRQTLQDNDAGNYSAEAREWAITNGLFNGAGILPDGTPNYMWEDLLTREQAATLFYRFAQTKGLS